jgi:hypothetical protein
VSIQSIQHHQRQALNYRIQHGTMTVKLLHQKTGLSQAHLSLFIHARRNLSISAMDKVLLAQGFDVQVVPLSAVRE